MHCKEIPNTITCYIHIELTRFLLRFSLDVYSNDRIRLNVEEECK